MPRVDSLVWILIREFDVHAVNSSREWRYEKKEKSRGERRGVIRVKDRTTEFEAMIGVEWRQVRSAGHI